jgi:hypothetical protein
MALFLLAGSEERTTQLTELSFSEMIYGVLRVFFFPFSINTFPSDFVASLSQFFSCSPQFKASDFSLPLLSTQLAVGILGRGGENLSLDDFLGFLPNKECRVGF